MKFVELDFVMAAAEGCCTPESLAEFSGRSREICPCPGWHYAANNGYVNAYEGILKLGEFCSCKLILLGKRMNEPRLWRVILGIGKFTLSQRRVIGEVGTWDVLKSGSIFQEPFQHNEVLAYANKANDLSVWIEALKTGTLLRSDVKQLMRRKSSEDNSLLARHIIRTGLLTDKEVRSYLRTLKYWQVDAAFTYADLCRLRGQKLLSFAVFVEKMVNYAHMEDFWVKALSGGKHGLSRAQLLQLLATDEQKRRNWQDRHSEKLVVAAIRSGLLGKDDLNQIRQHYRSAYVQSAILDVAMAA